MQSQIKCIIQGALVIDPAASGSLKESVKDVRIAGGVISEVQERLTPADDETVIKADGLWLTPGLIDIHTHLRDLGQSDREDIETGTQAAAFGGYTTVLAMANTDPPTDSALVLARILDKIKEKACIQVLPAVCVTKGMAGEELTNMVELAGMGAGAFSDDGMPVTNLAVLRRALEYSKLTGKIIISHPEDKGLSGEGCMNESATSAKLGLPGIPTASESACIAREIELVRHTGCPLHFAHVSAEASVHLIAQAKADGLPVSGDVTPHHLVLADEDIVEYNTSFKMNPPLRSRKDQDALVEALKRGTLEVIATDHAPHTRQDKQKTFDSAPFGVIGLETALPLLLERLVTPKHMSPLALISALTVNPARVIRIPIPAIKAGAPANLALIAPNHKWVYDAGHGCSRSRNSPFHQRELTGKCVTTIYGGAIVYRDDSFMAARSTSKESSLKSKV